jgi:hypothetical protein
MRPEAQRGLRFLLFHMRHTIAPVILALLALLLVGDAPPPDVPQVLRRAIANQQQNIKVRDDYTYVERGVERQLDSKGRVKKTEVETREILWIEGTPFEKLIARDDQPLSPKEAAKEQERIEKETRKRLGETPAEREKRLRDREKRKQESREITRETLEAFDWRFAGREAVNGIPCLVIEATPRRGYRPQKKVVEILRHMTGRIWLTEDTNDLVKFDAIVTDTITVGGVLARVNKGTHLILEQIKVNDEVWLPRRFTGKLDARVLVLKKFNIERENIYSDYKKFRVETREIPVQ